MSEDPKQAAFECWRRFRALRAVGFLITQTEGKGAFDWEGEPMQDLGTLVEMLAEQGIEEANLILEDRVEPLKANA